MPSVGVKHIVAAKYHEGSNESAPSYTEGMVLAEAIKVDTKWDKGDATVYSDDALSESDTSVTGGKQTLEVNHLSLAKQAYVLGHSYSVANGLTEKEGDTAPYVGHGYYGRSVLHGTVSYIAVWIYKTQFGQPDESLETKNNKPKFTTPKIEGTIMQASDGKFRTINEFTTEKAARDWLDGMAGVTPQCTAPVASVESGTYEASQSVVLTAGSGEEIHYTTNGLTPTKDSTKYTEAISVSSSTAIRAIATKEGSSNSAESDYEYVITA